MKKRYKPVESHEQFYESLELLNKSIEDSMENSEFEDDGEKASCQAALDLWSDLQAIEIFGPYDRFDPNWRQLEKEEFNRQMDREILKELEREALEDEEFY